jgi:hypothetical protein
MTYFNKYNKYNSKLIQIGSAEIIEDINNIFDNITVVIIQLKI